MTDLATRSNELAEIRSIMTNSPAAYFKDEGLQQRYRDLVGQPVAGSVLTGDVPATAPVPIMRPKEYAAEMGSMAGYDEYVKLSRLAADFALAVPDNERDVFIASFEALPLPVATECLREMRRPSVRAGQTDADELSRFATTAEGRVLVPEWRGMAATYHARVKARVWRIIDNLDLNSVSAFGDWHEGLPTMSLVAVYRKLAA